MAQSLENMDEVRACVKNERRPVFSIPYTKDSRVNIPTGIKTVYDPVRNAVVRPWLGLAGRDLFRWVASDFAVIDVIESGIVKVSARSC